MSVINGNNKRNLLLPMLVFLLLFCVGSVWVYASVHHIDGGSNNGNAIGGNSPGAAITSMSNKIKNNLNTSPQSSLQTTASADVNTESNHLRALGATSISAKTKSNAPMVNITMMTTKGIGEVILQVEPQWAPLGAERFLELVDQGYYDGNRFFRVIKKFMAQVGIHGDPTMNQKWRGKSIQDDPAIGQTNARGTVTFAHAGKNTRSCQIFFNSVNNKYLDKDFTPFAKIVSGVEHIDNLYGDYGEGGRGDGTDGRGPSQHRVVTQGNKYLDQYFPKLSYIISAKRMN